MRRTGLLATLAAFGTTILVGGQDVRAADSAERDIVVESAKKISNKDSKIKVSVWADREDSTYEVGEEAVFFFKADQDSYVTLLNVGTSGRITVLFPNKWDKENYVRAGKVYRVPPEDAGYKFQMSGPAGTEVLKAIATTDEHDFRKVMSEHGDFYAPQSSGRDFIERDIVPVLDKKSKDAWGEYTKIIETVDRRGRDDRGDRRKHRGEEDEGDEDRDGLEVELWSKKARYEKGDEVAFYAQCNQDCYLTLVQFTTSGDVRVLFPNKYDTKNFLRGGQEYRFPSASAKEKYLVGGPAGTEVIRAIATTKDEPVFANMDYSSGSYAQMPRSTAERDISVVDTRRKSKPGDVDDAVLEIEIED